MRKTFRHQIIQNRKPPEEQRLIIYESLPVYDSESNELVEKVEIP